MRRGGSSVRTESQPLDQGANPENGDERRLGLPCIGEKGADLSGTGGFRPQVQQQAAQSGLREPRSGGDGVDRRLETIKALQAPYHAQENGFLRREVVVQPPLRARGLPADVLHRGFRVALAGERRQSHREDVLACAH